MTKRLIVTGAMRSGTTMIAGDVCSEVLGLRPRSECTALSDLIQLANRWRTQFDEIRTRDWLRNSPSGGATDELLKCGVNTLMPVSDEVTWWIAKDPELVLYPHELEQLLLNESNYLLICLRDPRDVMASALEVQKNQQYGHSREFYFNRVWQALDGVRTIAQHRETNSRFHIVRYENFCRVPTNELLRIARWLNEPYDGSTSSGDARTTSLSPDDPYVTPLMRRPVTDSQIGSFRNRLSVQDQKEVSHVFSGICEYFGYQQRASNLDR